MCPSVHLSGPFVAFRRAPVCIPLSQIKAADSLVLFLETVHHLSPFRNVFFSLVTTSKIAVSDTAANRGVDPCYHLVDTVHRL